MRTSAKYAALFPVLVPLGFYRTGVVVFIHNVQGNRGRANAALACLQTREGPSSERAVAWMNMAKHGIIGLC